MKTLTKQTTRYFIKYIKQHKWLFTAMVISMLGAIAMGTALPLVYKEIIDAAVETGTADKAEILNSMMYFVFLILVIEFFHNAFFRFNEYANNYFQANSMRKIGNECFNYLHRHSYRFFSNNFAGALVRKVNRLISAFENFADRVYWDLIPIVTRVCMAIAIITYFSTTIALTLAVWMVFYIIAIYKYSIWKYPTEVEARKHDSGLSAIMADTITNNTNIQLFTANKFEENRFASATQAWYKITRNLWNLSSHANTFQGFTMGALNVLVIYLFVKEWSAGAVTVGFFVVIQAYLGVIFENLWGIGRVLQDFFKAYADAEDMIKILNTPHEVDNTSYATTLYPQGAKIEFKNVSFTYQLTQYTKKQTNTFSPLTRGDVAQKKPETKSKSLETREEDPNMKSCDRGVGEGAAEFNPRYILHNFNLTIKPGEKIALVGHSGEGKTTITKLIMRFFDIQQGQILFDSQDISQVTLDSLRGNISLVPQEPILFHRTLAENIAYGKPEATKEEMEEASKKANCHEFISKLKDGYNTYVGERGIKLSGGERQRVAIARAILEDAPLVILDEATSSLDSHAEKQIQQALHNLLEHKTSIIIAHRLSTIMESDRIIVIEKGQIKEQGSHYELLKKKEGVYKHLWDLQAGGFITD
jgi:ATP-binding cassette, subfamily B, bacterial